MKKIYNTKILLSAFFLAAGIFIYGQETSNLINNAGENTELPNITPPSPESYFRTQFGNLEANEFKGNPNVDIPLHTVIAGDLKHALSLRYAKAGVKVNDVPNSVGMNWILEAGGVITRTIYDISDEAATQRLLLNNSDTASFLTTTNGEQTLGTYVHDLGNYIDNEIDIFNYSIPGYSGSFYLNSNFQPVLFTKNNDLKIETVGNFGTSYSFKITLNDGTKYFFGDIGFTEKTLVRENPLQGGVTSFYLSKIETQSNKIEFEYIHNNSKVFNLSKSEQKGIATTTFFGSNSDVFSLQTTPYSQSLNNLHVIYPLSVKKIKTDNEEVIFNYDTDQYEIFPKLGSLNILKSGIILKKIVFDYINNNTTVKSQKRFFLSAVKEYIIKNNQETFASEYNLEYDDPLDLPVYLSNSIDYLGYYNGVFNTNSLLPNLNLFNGINQADPFSLHQNQYPYNYADRRPNFEFAKKGTLKAITYPTKGKTVFEYEPVFARKAAYMEQNILIGDAASAVGYEEFANPSCIPVIYNCSTTLSSSEMVADDKMYITLNLHTDDTSWVGIRAKAIFDIIDSSTNQVAYTKLITIPKIQFYASNDMTFSTDFTAQPGKAYQLKFRIADNICNQCFGTATIKYQNGWEPVDDGNIRLKKQYDVSDNNIFNIKRYYYTKYSEINNLENLPDSYKPYFYSFASKQTIYNILVGSGQLPPAMGEPICAAETILHSTPTLNYRYFNSLDSEYLYGIDDPIYPEVTISYGGDNFEKGGQEKKFDTFGHNFLNSYTFRDPKPDELDGVTTNILSKLLRSMENRYSKHFPLSNLSGRMLSDKIFINKQNSLFIKNSYENNFNSLQTGFISSIVGAELYKYMLIPSGLNLGTSLDNYYVGAISLPSYSSFLNTTVSKEYLEDVPVMTTDDSPYKKIITTTEYTYDNPEKQLSKNSTVLQDNTILETSYLYAHEKSNQKLITANMIGIPLETTTIKKQNANDAGKIVSKTEVVYPDQNNYPTAQAGSLLLPLSVKSADQLTGVMSTEASYDKYDEKGNILQYTTRDGIPVTIVWGYNKTQPIAKIEGITYDQLTSLASPTAIVTASDNDAADPSKEGLLLEALNSFRKNSQLTDKKVTTYTYDPLIGVTSITPPSGIRQVFAYDTANRLKETKVRSKNSAGAYTDKKAAEYKYNYKP
ncbi:hypothetical protein [Chryseobacterium gregarium]|uniref:hypothetical protein n=1 Tax=Chryseobacterium gregarium TaxID=456299 RepID=UPI000404C054|nr:hypothetical protein [Chryseobacterium gregarium]